MPENCQKQVAQRKQRNYIKRIANFWFGRRHMPKQAKTITPQDLRRLLDFVAANKHSVRNRTMLLATHLAGMRVGEVASLRYGDVVNDTGEVRDQINLIPEQTKGRHARAVFVNARFRRELEAYLVSHPMQNSTDRLFYTQKKGRAGFTPNTLAQYFHYLYKRAGIQGGSSHSGRRTFITNLASKGVGVRVLMSLAGHRHIGTTQAYIDVNDDMKRKAVEMV
jgi:integrase/recombinase XerD